MLSLWCQDEIQVQFPRGRLIALVVLEVYDQIVLDREDSVRGEPGVVFRVDLRDDGLVVFMCDLPVSFAQKSVLKHLPSCGCVPDALDACPAAAEASMTDHPAAENMRSALDRAVCTLHFHPS